MNQLLRRQYHDCADSDLAAFGFTPHHSSGSAHPGFLDPWFVVTGKVKDVGRLDFHTTQHNVAQPNLGWVVFWVEHSDAALSPGYDWGQRPCLGLGANFGL